MRELRRERILLRLDDAEENRIRLLALQTRTSINDIIKRCIAASLDTVEMRLITEATRAGKFRELGSAMERIDGLRTECNPMPTEEPTK